MTSPIVTIVVGQDARLFAAHEDVLSASPFFSAIIRGQFLESHSKRVTLPDEVPEIFSSVLEYLYKGDYYPRLLHNKRQDRWELEDVSPTSPFAGGTRGQVESTVYSPLDGQLLLKDTLLYCTADKYGLDDLKRLALRKQGLQSGIQCATILASARFAYANTPDSDSKLRAHYLALIIRSRGTFKRSGTMQMEMERGGKLYVPCFPCFLAHNIPFLPLDHALMVYLPQILRPLLRVVKPSRRHGSHHEVAAHTSLTRLLPHSTTPIQFNYSNGPPQLRMLRAATIYPLFFPLLSYPQSLPHQHFYSLFRPFQFQGGRLTSRSRKSVILPNLPLRTEDRGKGGRGIRGVFL